MNLKDHAHVTRIGVDIGGTFTDLASVDAAGRFHMAKVLTTHGEEDAGVLSALDATDVDPSAPRTVLAHGTTLVINALLERNGARVALITTKGFGDIVELGRGNRPEMFNLKYRRDSPLIPAEFRYEIAERVASDGRVLVSPTPGELDDLASWIDANDVEAVAIAFMNAYAQPSNECLVADFVQSRNPEVHVTTSSELSRKWREYERFSSASANAFVAPVAEKYLDRLSDGLTRRSFAGEFVVLDSSGGALSTTLAKRLPVRLVESGPVAGVVGAQELAAALRLEKVVTFDMGGTTAKTALIEDGEYAATDLYWIGGPARGFPLQVPTVDIIEVGAGGGSIAWVDDAGRLMVGPRSAGSKPGPACYGLGGTEPTITDANLHCGRLDPRSISGSLTLDPELARMALVPLAERLNMSTRRLALGILKLGTLSMAAAVRRQTLERGRDPREYSMVAIGGAGPMHVCDVATEVGVKRIVVPRHPGHFCAIGMLGANLRLDQTEIVHTRFDLVDWEALAAKIQSVGDELTARLGEGNELGLTANYKFSLTMRYSGQEHALRLSAPTQDLQPSDSLGKTFKALFEDEYERRYGHTNAGSHIEVVDAEIIAERGLPRPIIDAPREHASATGSTVLDGYFDLNGTAVPTPSIPRGSISPGETLAGPLVIHEEGATTVVPPKASVSVHDDGSLVIELTLGDE